MLNYIWLTLLLLGIGTALTVDIIDSTNNNFRNGASLKTTLIFENTSKEKSKVCTLKVEPAAFNSFYDSHERDTIVHSMNVTYSQKDKDYVVYFTVNEKSPSIWKEMAKVNGKENDLTGKLILTRQIDSLTYSAALTLEEISFAKMKEVTNSAIEYAATAVNIALGLIGIMALWLGVMKIAEQAGLISIIAKIVRPVTKFLFPDVPHDHPAIGSMIMNISANMLGLGNAATPFGLKAMEELDKINPQKGIATNAMCTFLAINTAGLTLIPATAIAVRAAAGSSDPAIIIGTSFFGASCATLMAIIAAKTLEKFPMKFSEVGNRIRKSIKGFFIITIILISLIILFATGALSSILKFVDVGTIKIAIQVISILAIPLIILSFVIYGAIKKVKLYEVFVEGAKEGFNIAIKIIPYLVAMLVAIGIFRAGGAMNILTLILSPVTNVIGMPAEALPMALMRPLSGSGSLGVMAEIMKVHGPDSFIGILVSTIMGSTETTFYVLALYFGAVNIKKMRHAVAAGILADIAGILGALFIVKLLFG